MAGIYAHVEHYGHWIPQDPAGRKEAVLRPEICWIFSGRFQLISCAFLQEPVRKHRKEFENFPVGILLPLSSDFRCFPAGTGPYFSAWVVI
jgi:hypothetical protein